ncbi:MAG: hypothetical protein QM762_26655 [Chryseolinea sp.]
MTDFVTNYQPRPDEQMLIEKAESALIQAYAPYSGFHVAAALLLDNGVIVTGTNQENVGLSRRNVR